MSTTPTPATVRQARAYRLQREAAWEMNERTRRTHRNGYHGPLTRAELAALAARQQ